MMNEKELLIQSLVDRETEAWNNQDADTLVSLFHPDMVWPWPQNAHEHDPAHWVFPQGRYNRDRWKESWEDLFRTHRLVHNKRKTIRIVVSDQGDGAFAVVDVDTLWRHRNNGSLIQWKGRACKGYTNVHGTWLLIFHTGLLDYSNIQPAG
jgi:ketosteroid isomerase-like protein